MEKTRATFFILFSPLLASAQAITTVPTLFTFALNILNVYVVPIIFAIAFVFFIFGIYRYFIQNGGNAEKVQEGQKFVLWSVIGFVIMFSVWGIINLFINTLGFGGAAQPDFPTFNVPINNSDDGNSLESDIANLFGGSSDSDTSTSGLGAIGSTFTDALGNTYTITGANTYAPGPNGCGTTGTLVGSQCVANGSVNNGSNGGTNGANGAKTASAATATTGTPCTNNDQCPDVCNVATGTCAASGPTTYDCADSSTPVNGICANGSSPVNSNGQTPPAGQNGSPCTNNDQCPDVCNVATGTCGSSGLNTYACNDGATLNAVTGVCSDGQPPENSGDGVAAANYSVPLGGSCAGNPNACVTANATCNNNICVGADGTVEPGGACTTDSNCDDVGGQTYGCYPEGNGTCTLNGVAPAGAGQLCTDGTTAPAGNSCVSCPGIGTSDTAQDCSNDQILGNMDANGNPIGGSNSGGGSTYTAICSDGTIGTTCYPCASGVTTSNPSYCTENGGNE